MAIQYQSGLLNDFFRRQNQRRAGTGLPTSYQEQRGLLDPMLAYEAQRETEAGRRRDAMSLEQQRIDIAKEAQSTNKLTGVIGGVGQLAMLPLAYGAGKNMGWWGGSTAPPTVAPATTPNLMFAPPAGAATAQGAVGATGTVGGAQQLAGAAYPGIAGGTATPAAVGPMSAVGAGETAGTGLLGTTGTVAGPAGLAGTAGSYLGGALGEAVARRTGMHEKSAGDVGAVGGGVVAGAVAGAMAGATSTSWSGPGAIIGGVIGGIIGGISRLF
jgi:hypothetical protein